MKRYLLLLLLIPSICFGDSESTIGGKTAQAHIIQSGGTSIRPRPYLDFEGGITCADTNGKSVCTSTSLSPISIVNNNVGISSTHPGTKLDVQGTVRAISFIGDGSQLTGISSPWSRTSPYVYPATITDNVGIGTSNPVSALQTIGSLQVNSFSNVTATGGTTTTVGNQSIHTYTTGSNFVVTTGGTVSYLVVGGGAGGGYGDGGGGGAGGYLTGSLTVTPGTYAITVGNGGNAGTSTTAGSNGTDSIFSSIDAVGGGGGGTNFNVGTRNGANGGSGGGAGVNSVTGGTATGGQGFNGGASFSGGFANGGGGGGSASIGVDAVNANGGAGGGGLSSSISSASVTYACGGGGGGTGAAGAAGCSSAGAGGANNAADNSGSGGGGGNSGSAGGNGGSGIVIISFSMITTQGPQSFVVSSGGNVGVGTLAPINSLDVNGAVAVGAGYAGFATAPSNGLIVKGNVGIGTWVPINPLSIAAPSSQVALGLFTNSPTAAGLVAINLYTQANRGLGSQVIGNNVGSGGLDFWTNTGLTDTMTLTSGGNVGIGTTTPGAAMVVMGGNVGIGTWTTQGISQPLTVKGDIYEASGTGRIVSNAVNSVALVLNSGSTDFGNFQNETGRNAWSFASNSSATSLSTSPIMTWTKGQNVGIGTSNPLGALTVMSGNVGIGTWVPSQSLEVKNGNFQVTSANGSTPLKILAGNTTSTIQIFNNGGSASNIDSGTSLVGNGSSYFNGGNVGIGTDMTSASGSLIVMGGNIGIGTIAPGAALSFGGACKASGIGQDVCWGTSTSGAACIGYCTAGTFPACSACTCC